MNDTVQIVPIPPNIDTVNTLFGTNINTEQDMVDWLDQRRPKALFTFTWNLYILV